MRPVAIVLAITLVGGCIPVPTRGQAHAGNALLIAASSYALMSASNRDCDYHRMDLFDEGIAEAGCVAGSQLELMIASSVAVSALIGIMRTLYRPPAATAASRSR